MWKFAPTNDAELITWYRRIERRRTVFDQGCVADIGIVRPAFLLTTPAGVSRLATTCGPEVFRAGQWILLRNMQWLLPQRPRTSHTRCLQSFPSYFSTITCPYIHGCGVQM